MTRQINFYEVTLFDVDGEFHVAKPNDLGHGYATEAEAIADMSEGYVSFYPIEEHELPAPLNNDHYTDLQLYRLESKYGSSYAGIAQM